MTTCIRFFVTSKHLSVGFGRRQVCEDSTLCSFTIDFESCSLYRYLWKHLLVVKPLLMKIKTFETICIWKVELRFLLPTNLENPLVFANAKPCIRSLVKLRIFLVGEGGVFKMNNSPRRVLALCRV